MREQNTKAQEKNRNYWMIIIHYPPITHANHLHMFIFISNSLLGTLQLIKPRDHSSDYVENYLEMFVWHPPSLVQSQLQKY